MEVQLIIAIIGWVISLFAIYYKITQDAQKKLDDAIKEGDDKRAVIWERFDHLKKEHNNDIVNIRKELSEVFVSANVCKIIHQNNDKVLEKIDRCLSNIEEQLKELNTKVARYPVL